MLTDDHNIMDMHDGTGNETKHSRNTLVAQETTNISDSIIPSENNETNSDDELNKKAKLRDCNFTKDDRSKQKCTNTYSERNDINSTLSEANVLKNGKEAESNDIGRFTDSETNNIARTTDSFDGADTTVNLDNLYQTTRLEPKRYSGELKTFVKRERKASKASTISYSASQSSNATSGYETAIPILHVSNSFPRTINNQRTYCKHDMDSNGQYIETTKRCDDLVNNFQAIKQQHESLNVLYRKHKKLFVSLAIINLVLISCVICVIIPIMTVMFGLDQQNLYNSDSETRMDLASVPPSVDYNICFNCTYLETDPDFSKHTVTGIFTKGESCCFGSITEMYLSLQKNFQYQLDDASKLLKDSVDSVKNELMILDFNTKHNTSQESIIFRVLQLNMPREKTVVHLISKGGVPVEEENTMSGRFYKLNWNVKSTNTVRTGKVRIDKDGLNVVVQSEAYYFLYTRLQFKANLANRYEDVLVTYTINRQRGSTSTYIHEAKERCKFTDTSHMHSSVSELVVHLSTFDQIFVSVSSSDIQYLSSDDGAHVFGLFEL